MTETRVELPESFDFETYINNYSGFNRIKRCLYIAKKSNEFSIEAYKCAIEDIKNTTFNIDGYKVALEELNEKLNKKGEAVVPCDKKWIAKARSSSKSALRLLEEDLKEAEAELMKEKTWQCYIRLGEHYQKCGITMSALKYFFRAREYCTTAKHNIETCFINIKIHIDDCHFTSILKNYISRAEAVPDNVHTLETSTRLKCFQAVILLGTADTSKKYRDIAEALIDIPFESSLSCNDILSPNDIAIYGGLTALATFSRRELHTRVLSNFNFKNFMGLEPLIYELVEAFYQSKYSRFLKLLNEYKQQLNLDMFMESKVENLVQLVKEKAVLQYCIPYSNIDMIKMAQAFDIDVYVLENYLVTLIGKNEMISARIDSHNKIVYTKEQNKRTKAFKESYSTGNDFEKSSKALLLRLSLIKADLIIK